MNKLKTLQYLIIFYTLLIFVSCSFPRKLFKEPLKEKGSSYLFEELKKKEYQYKTLTTKFNAELDVDRKLNSFSGMLRIAKDSVIWVSITPALGLEMARIYITPDSVKFVNRIESTYFIGDYNFLNDWFQVDFDFDMIQSLLTGNDFACYQNDVFKASIDKRLYKLSTLNRNKLKKHLRKNEKVKVVLQDIWLDPYTFKIKKNQIKEIKSNRKLNAQFNSFMKINEQLFAQNLLFKIDAEKKIEIDLNYLKISFDKELEFPFNIPSNYSRIERK